jgi:hypothetical protein
MNQYYYQIQRNAKRSRVELNAPYSESNSPLYILNQQCKNIKQKQYNRFIVTIIHKLVDIMFTNCKINHIGFEKINVTLVCPLSHDQFLDLDGNIIDYINLFELQTIHCQKDIQIFFESFPHIITNSTKILNDCNNPYQIFISFDIFSSSKNIINFQEQILKRCYRSSIRNHQNIVVDIHSLFRK